MCSIDNSNLETKISDDDISYIKRLKTSATYTGTADCETVGQILIEYKSKILKEVFTELLEDIKGTCKEHLRINRALDGTPSTFKYYTIDVADIEKILEKLKNK